jgi:hypothetical protein
MSISCGSKLTPTRGTCAHCGFFGFKREGLLRARYLADGELQDAVALGLLRREWLGR